MSIDWRDIAILVLAIAWLITNIRINRIAYNLCLAIIKGDTQTYRIATGTNGVPYDSIELEDNE